MNLHRIITIAKKDWKKTVRDPAVLFMIVLFPLVMTIAFGVSFGAVGGGSPTYTVGVVDLGSGNGTYSGRFTQALAATGVLKVQSYPGNDSAQSALSQGRVQGVLVIPSSFDAGVQSYRSFPTDPGMWVNSSVQLYLDRASMLSSQVAPSVVIQTLNTAILGIHQSGPESPVSVASPSLVSAESVTVFDTFAPGLFAFASIYLITMVAGSFTGERESGILNRIVVTPATGSDVMLGSAVSYLVVGLVQVILVLASAYALGFHPDSGPAGLLVGILIATVFALCNVGFGLITASIARSASAATGLSFIFLLPQLFLGTFVGSALGSAAQTAGKYVPAYYVTDALTSLFSRGASPTSPAVITDLAVVGVVSVVVLLLGILLFERRSKL